MCSEKYVLSVQSHVARDYVGNKAAVFPLQRLGIPVDFVNSVEFSSMFIHDGHTINGKQVDILLGGLLKATHNPRGGGYPGSKYSDLASICGLPTSECTLEKAAKHIGSPYTHILSGYIGNVDFLKVLTSFIRGLKQHHTHTHSPLFWLCDPVLGDNGVFYVGQEMVDCYVKESLPIADLITPNQFEAEVISGVTHLGCFNDVIKCCENIHQIGPTHIVITSTQLDHDHDHLYLFGSTKTSSKPHIFYIKFPRKQIYFGGTGDVMASLLIAHIHEGLQIACEKTLTIVQDLITYSLNKPVKPMSVDIIGGQEFFTQTNSRFEGQSLTQS